VTTIAPQPPPAAPPVVDPLVTFTDLAPIDVPTPHPPLGPLAATLEARLAEVTAPAEALAYSRARSLRRAIPQQLEAARAPIAAELAPVRQWQRHIAETNDSSRGAQAAAWLLTTQADSIRARLTPAFEPVMRTAEQALDAEYRLQEQIIAADRDVPPLDGPGHAAIAGLLAALPHIDAPEKDERLAALVTEALREPVTPAVRAVMRHLLPIARTLAREADPTSDSGIRLGALTFALEQASKTPEVVAATRMKQFVELARYELPKLQSALAAELGNAEAVIDARLTRRTLVFFGAP
jgi:hypothetical protein